MALDAADKNSYSGTGDTWVDLTGNGNNGQLINSPAFSNGLFSFNGSTNYIDISNINFSTGTYTIIGSSRYNGTPRGRIISGLNSNWIMGHWGGWTENYYASAWVSSSSGSGNRDTNWRIFATTSDTVSNAYALYVNGNLKVNNANGRNGPNGLRIGTGGSGTTGEYSNGQCGFILAYNRILTEGEILQNYNASKSRFGL